MRNVAAADLGPDASPTAATTATATTATTEAGDGAGAGVGVSIVDLAERLVGLLQRHAYLHHTGRIVRFYTDPGRYHDHRMCSLAPPSSTCSPHYPLLPP